MPPIKPGQFSLKNLWIDVRLDAELNGDSYDFLGKKAFSAQMFRENIGFGITNIDIEVNTSLQPLVEITFKDLYGNTSMSETPKNQDIDFKVLHAWPPPKFRLSFKGYLGKPVTWLLNLQKTNINYVASDGSYEIKCTFVPNLWGFFGDIPMMFLKAVKGLRKSGFGNENQPEVFSVFDLKEIGRKVDLQTNETTTQFDTILNQLNALKSGAGNLVLNSSQLSYDEAITGVIAGGPIQGFVPLEVPNPIPLGLTEGSKDEGDLNNLFNNGANSQTAFNNFTLSTVNQGEIVKGVFKKTIDGVRTPYDKNTFFSPGTDTDITAKINEINGIIDKNIQLIKDEIKGRVFLSTKTKIGKLTISKVLSTLAGDAGYILGRILEAGFEGAAGGGPTPDSNLAQERQSASKNGKIIGTAYPLQLDGEDQEVPADIGRYGNTELKFVNEFIQAISEGIANETKAEDLNAVIEDRKTSKRINNITAPLSNMYNEDYNRISTSIMVNSGVAAFMTRSNDPNRPGNYDNTISDNDNSGNIIELAKKDASNITDAMIGRMSTGDKDLLKRFCKFWDNLLSDDAEWFRNIDGKNTLEISDKEQDDLTEDVSDELLDYVVVLSNSSQVDSELLKTQESIKEVIGFDENNKTKWKGVDGLDVDTLRRFLVERMVSVSNGRSLSTVDPKKLAAYKIRHNNLTYMFPRDEDNGKFFVMFRGITNINNVIESNSNPSDAQDRDTDQDNSSEPLGLVQITKPTDGENPLGRIEFINEQISAGRVVDFSKLRKGEGFVENRTIPSQAERDSILWTQQVATSTDASSPNVIAAKDLAYMVYASQDDSDSPNAVFGPFVDGDKGVNQRVYIKNMCVEILAKIDKKDEEKQQVVSSVLGNASDQEKIIYKQFHNIFQQWNILANLKDSGDYRGLADRISNKLGKNHIDLFSSPNIGDDKEILDLEEYARLRGEEIADGTFLYDYPLQHLGGGKTVNVREAIINIDPLGKDDSRTTVLNMLQQLCSKNNFMFIPIPGYAGFNSVKEIYSPDLSPLPNGELVNLTNYFHVIFTPTPESRALLSNQGQESQYEKDLETQRGLSANALEVKFGSPDNQVVKNVSVGTDSTKPTAESIVNLQRLADNENQNKTVSTDCSMLSVYEGRSYKANIDVLGNAQIFPMQFFFLENMPMFGGLYQIMKVKHTITPNNMDTSLEGIRMRFSNGKYGGVPPITLGTLEGFASSVSPNVVIDVATNPGNRSEASAENLAIASEFNNLTEKMDRLQKLDELKLHPEFKALFAEFVEAVETETNFLVHVTSPLRSIETQAWLNGTEEKNADAGKSRHNFGLAVDINGKDKTTGDFVLRKNTPKATWEASGIPAIAARLGLIWGGNFSNYYDPVHFAFRIKGGTSSKILTMADLKVLYNQNKRDSDGFVIVTEA